MEQSKEKIICVGLHKTGTTSLGHAFSMLGLKSTGWCDETASLFHRGHQNALIDMMQDFDSFEDAPWYLLYQQAAAQYPVKFILTHRADYELWFTSLIKHNQRIPPDQFSFRKYMYGSHELVDIKDSVIAKHKAHVEEVRSFASEKDIPLLEVCWENGDGWEELCSFLGKDIPTRDFPHSNAAPSTYSKIKAKLKRLMP